MANKILTSEKAEILGLLCAEGTHYKYISLYTRFFENRGKYYFTVQPKEQIQFTNLNLGLLNHFRNLLKRVYNYSPKISGVKDSLKVPITKNHIMKDILSFTDLGYAKWVVPNAILNSSNDVKSAFIRGVYEGDGVKLQKRGKQVYLFFDMKNKNGLIQIKNLLNELGITSNVHKNSRDMSRLIVYGRENVIKFKNIIKPRFKRIEIN